MKILMLTDFCKPTLGGIEQHVFSLSKKLIENGHQVIIVTVNQKGLRSMERYNGICIYRLNSLFQKVPFMYTNVTKKYHPPFQDFLLRKELASLVRAFKPDVIHCHGWIVFSYLPLKSKFAIPLISTLHHYGFLCPKQDLFFENKQSCKRPFTPNCYHCGTKQFGVLRSTVLFNLLNYSKKNFLKIDRFIAVSDFVKHSHTRHLKLPINQISTIPNFCETGTEPDFDCNDLPSDFVLYVGQLVPYKGVDFLLAAYNSSEIDLPLVLIGGKHQKHNYKKFEAENKIIVKENAPRELVLTALRKCSFVSIPSIWPDPCPTTVLEAMFFGKAVIGSKSGGIPEMVTHEKTGYVVDPRNIQEFAGYLTLLANNQFLREKMGANAKRRFLEHFAAEKVVKAIELVYDDVLEK